jgi:hypothetical protein
MCARICEFTLETHMHAVAQSVVRKLHGSESTSDTFYSMGTETPSFHKTQRFTNVHIEFLTVTYIKIPAFWGLAGCGLPEK